MLKVTEVARPSRGLTPRAGGPRSVSAKPPAGSNWRTSRSPTFPSVKLASPGGLRRHGSGPADLAIDGDSPRGSPPNASFKWLRRQVGDVTAPVLQISPSRSTPSRRPRCRRRPH